jgi:hypothetical protein
MVQMIIEVDNQYCSADVPTIDIAITNVVGMRSNQNSTSDSRTMFSKSINGLKAGDKCTGNEAIRESFPLQSNQELKPTCSGKLLSSDFSLSVTLRHDISCECCSDQVLASIPVVSIMICRLFSLLCICTRCLLSSRPTGPHSKCPSPTLHSPMILPTLNLTECNRAILNKDIPLNNKDIPHNKVTPHNSRDIHLSSKATPHNSKDILRRS